MIINWLNDCSSVEHEKEQCLEDYHQRFGHAKRLYKNGAKTAELWSVKVPHAGRVRTSLNIFKLNQTCFIESSLEMRHTFWIQPRNQALEQLVEVIKAKESKTIKRQSHTDHILSCERHHPQQVLAIGLDDQSTNL